MKKQGKESDSLSNDDSDTSVKSRKKSGGAAGGRKSGGTKSIGVSRGWGESGNSDEAKNRGEGEE